MRNLAGIMCTIVIIGYAIGCPGIVFSDACDEPGSDQTELGLILSDGTQIPANGREVSIQGTLLGVEARYVRLLISVNDHLATGWILSIRDHDRVLQESFGSNQFRGVNTRWTRRLNAPGGDIVATLEVASAGSDPGVTIVKTVAMPKDAMHTYYSYSGDKPKWSPLRHAGSAARILGDSVGFILGNAGTVAWCCSGVVVAENILLTNWHCGNAQRTGEMWTPEICRSTIVNFAWDEYPDTPGAKDFRDREFLCEEVLSVDEFLDIALLKIAPLNGADTARPIPIRPGQLTNAETIDLIHHPGCEPKRISASCQVNTVNYSNWQDPSRKTDILHSCDSEAGSSGAGVFDKSGNLVALHHIGYQKKGEVCDYQNKAVSIKEILQFVKDKKPDIFRLLNIHP